MLARVRNYLVLPPQGPRRQPAPLVAAPQRNGDGNQLTDLRLGEELTIESNPSRNEIKCGAVNKAKLFLGIPNAFSQVRVVSSPNRAPNIWRL
jgi:hypothetical protein